MELTVFEYAGQVVLLSLSLGLVALMGVWLDRWVYQLIQSRYPYLRGHGSPLTLLLVGTITEIGFSMGLLSSPNPYLIR
jgi:hypothetical protein